MSSSFNQEDLKLLSKIFDLDDIDCEIIRLVDRKSGVQAKEIALHIYLSRDASRRRAIKLTQKELLEAVQVKEKSLSVICFYLSSEIHSILVKIRALDSLDFSNKSFLESQNSEKFAYLRKNQSLEEKISNFPSTRRAVFSLVVTLKQSTSPIIASKLGIFPQAVRYHLEWLRGQNWILRNQLQDNPTAYYYFLNPEIDRQIVESIICADKYGAKPIKHMNSEHNILFKQEIPKLNNVDKDLLIEICNNPGLLLKELGKDLSCSIQTKKRYLKKLINIELVIRKKDSNFAGLRYYYYPAPGLTIKTLKYFLGLPISAKIHNSNFTEKTNMNDLNDLSVSDVQQDYQSSSDIIDWLSKLNYIDEQEKEIEEEERKIQERKCKIQELKQELIGKGGKEAEKFFSRR